MLDKQRQAPDAQGLSHYVLSKLDTKLPLGKNLPAQVYKRVLLDIPKAA